MAAPVHIPIVQMIEPHGEPMTDWSVQCVDSETLRPLLAYKDAKRSAEFGITIRADHMGRLPPFWLVPTGRTFNAVITYSDNRTRTIYDLELPAPPTTTDGSVVAFPMRTESGQAVELEAQDFGTIRDVPTGASSIPVTLPALANVPEGRLIGIRCDGLGGLIIQPQQGEGDAVPLEDGEVAFIVRAPGRYHVAMRTPPRARRYLVVNQTTTNPPTTSPAGEVYLAPTTAVSPWTARFLYRSRGDGTFDTIRPQEGDEAAIGNESDTVGVGASAKTLIRVMTYSNGEWKNRHEMLAQVKADIEAKIAADIAASATTSKRMIVRDESSSGTTSIAANGTTPTSGNAFNVKLNTTSVNTIPGATLSANAITLPKGDYDIRARRKVTGSFSAGILKFRSPNQVVIGEPVKSGSSNSDSDVWLTAIGRVNVGTSPEAFALEVTLTGFTSATILGHPVTLGTPEVWSVVEISAISVG